MWTAGLDRLLTTHQRTVTMDSLCGPGDWVGRGCTLQRTLLLASTPIAMIFQSCTCLVVM